MQCVGMMGIDGKSLQIDLLCLVELPCLVMTKRLLHQILGDRG
jgi:hypothetical protein